MITKYRLVSAASQNANAIKSSEGFLKYVIVSNGATIQYVKLYDKATAPSSSDTPILTIAIVSRTDTIIFPEPGLEFSNGLGIRITGGAADSDTANATVSMAFVQVGYR